MSAGVPVFGHRGAAAHALENTLASIGVAIAAGADGVEIDIRLTADEEVVLLHDATLDRTGMGRGPVAEALFADVRRAGVPSLRETLDFIDGRCALNVEIKAPESWPFAREIARVEKKTDVWFSSFDIALMERVAGDGFPVGLLYSARRKPVADAARLLDAARRIRPRALHLPKELLFPELVGPGMTPCFIWTINDPDEAALLVDRGARAIFTDDPALIIDKLARRG